MSNLNGGNVRSLMEAYHSIYQKKQEETLTEEQIIIDEFCESWFQQCIDEGVDFSQYSYDVILEAICEAMGQEMGTPTKPSIIDRAFNWLNRKLTPSGVVQSVNRRTPQGRTPVKDFLDSPKQDPMNNPAPQGRSDKGTPAPQGRSDKGSPAPTSKPSTPARPAAPAKPFVKQTGDKAKDEATWRTANPNLAVAADEKSRIRGTQQTDNPLVKKDMRSRLPMNSPSVQSPDVAKLGKGNQSLVNNPNAFKAATPAAKPKLSARAQALKAGGPKLGPRGM